jgi:hypothetical protein
MFAVVTRDIAIPCQYQVPLGKMSDTEYEDWTKESK